MEPFGQGFPEPVLVVRGLLAAPARVFGAGHRKFRLQGESEEFTLFAQGDAQEALDGALCLAVSPMDSARWGRSWRVDTFLAPAGDP
jgi:single-stranded DNA-specific DHH superfamily exonuclease